MKKIKYFTLALTFLFLLSFYGNSVATANYSFDQADFNIGIVYSTGGLGDQSFNDAAKRGIDAAIATHGNTISVDEACESGCDIPDITNAIEDLASDEAVDYDLIIGIGFSSGDGVNASAVNHPDTNFMIIDSFVDQPNVASITFKEHEGSFLVGALAAMVTQTDHLGFLGGLDIPLINKFGAGYEHGAKFINPDIDVSVAYSPNPNNPWGDVAGGKQVAEDFIEAGADIIYAAAGGTGLGVFEAVAEENTAAGETEFYGIGVDSVQDHLSEGNVLTSMVKRVDVAVEGQIDAVVDGSWSAGLTELGLAENGVGISPMEFTQEEANATYSFGTTRWEKVQDLKQQIIDGEIVVVDNYDALDTITFEAATPIPIVPIFVAIISVAAIVRKRR